MIQNEITLSTDLQQLVSSEIAWKYQVVPNDFVSDHLTCLTYKRDDLDSVKDDLEVLLGFQISFIEIEQLLLEQTLSKFYRRDNSLKSEELNINNIDSSDFLLKIIYDSKALGSSDIHIEKYEESARIRIRIDGVLIEKYKLNLEEYPELVNKIKIKSNLDITEKRMPQDGRINLPEFDIRVSILPTLYGEKIVLRILSRDTSSIDLEKLGLTNVEKSNYLEGIKKTNGIVLISGPTGSGKTTTLYATLKLLNEEKRNIVTVEDPIEYTLKGINQVQLKENIGLTFTSALRSFLRQDPDIIMLGEIRDVETAQMAIRAAQTGHLVLSTIHTNSAWGTISRLIDMGIPPFLLASTLNTSVAQRLVKVLCNNCKKQVKLDKNELPSKYQFEDISNHYVANGCENCFYTGYKGRKAIYEIINIDHDFINLIKNKELDIDQVLIEKNIEKLNEKAFRLFVNGETSLEEIYALLITN